MLGKNIKVRTFSYLATISAFSWAIKDSISFFMSEAVKQEEKKKKKGGGKGGGGEISKCVHSMGNTLGKC